MRYLCLALLTTTFSVFTTFTMNESKKDSKIDLKWAFSKFSTLQKLNTENLTIDGAPEYMQTHETTALLQEGLLAAHKAVTITQDGSDEPKIAIDTAQLTPLLAALSQLNKERQIWSLAVELSNAMIALRASAKPPHFFVNFDTLTNEDAKLLVHTETKLRSIDPNWKKTAEKLQKRRDEWQEKIAHRASKQPTMQELEEIDHKEPAFFGNFF